MSYNSIENTVNHEFMSPFCYDSSKIESQNLTSPVLETDAKKMSKSFWLLHEFGIG